MRAFALAFAIAVASASAGPGPASRPAGADSPPSPRDRLRAALAESPHGIVYESYHDRSWDLIRINADGSKARPVTRTPDVHELYPHVSPDGKRICFVADTGEGRKRARDVYVADIDGKNRKLVARNARQACWKPDGKAIAYVRGEYARFTTNSYGTKGLFFFDVATGKHTPHARRDILHLCYLCWAPGGKWMLGTVHGGMGYAHADLAIDTTGRDVYPLKAVTGCRPDVSADGKRVCWNATDQIIAIADLELSTRQPAVRNVGTLVRCTRERKVYHGDFSPDGRFVAFSVGPAGGAQHVGMAAAGWNIAVADATKRDLWVQVTTDGKHNKEPDWIKGARP